MFNIIINKGKNLLAQFLSNEEGSTTIIALKIVLLIYTLLLLLSWIG